MTVFSNRQIHTTAPFEGIPEHIDKLIGTRLPNDSVSPYPLNGYTNYTIVILSSSLIEGAIEAFLRSKLRNDSGIGRAVLQPANLLERMVLNLDVQLARATWKNTKQLYQVVVGTPLSDDVSTPTILEAVNTLFKLRNSTVAHGAFINVKGPGDLSGTREDYTWESSTLNEIEKYLRRRSLWTDSHLPDPIPEAWDFFRDAIVDHFYEGALRLLYDIDALSAIHGSSPRTTQIIDQFAIAK